MIPAPCQLVSCVFENLIIIVLEWSGELSFKLCKTIDEHSAFGGAFETCGARIVDDALDILAVGARVARQPGDGLRPLHCRGPAGAGEVEAVPSTYVAFLRIIFL